MNKKEQFTAAARELYQEIRKHDTLEGMVAFAIERRSAKAELHVEGVACGTRDSLLVVCGLLIEQYCKAHRESPFNILADLAATMILGDLNEDRPSAN